MRKKKEEYECLIRQLSLQQESSGAKDDENVIDGHPRRSSASAADSLVSPQPMLTKTNTMPLVSRESPTIHHHLPPSVQRQQQRQQPSQSTTEQSRSHPAPPTPPMQPPVSSSFLQRQPHPHLDSYQQQQQQQYTAHQPMLQRGDRPPRLKPFSLKKLIRKLWGTDPNAKDRNIDNPLPDKLETIRTIRRITSSPAPSTERRARSRSGGDRDRHTTPPSRSGSLTSKKEDQSFLIPGKVSVDDHEKKVKSHKRRSSDSFRGELTV